MVAPEDKLEFTAPRPRDALVAYSARTNATHGPERALPAPANDVPSDASRSPGTVHADARPPPARLAPRRREAITAKETSMLSTRTTCTIALATALSMPCFAQSTSGTDTSGSGGTTATTGTTAGSTSGMTNSTSTRGDGREDHGKWGWLGLIGLVGLLGLRRHSDAGHRVDTTRTSAQR
jgi:MYXO-CTERM domain-containing protein